MESSLLNSSNCSFPEKLMLLLSYIETECNRLGKSADEACIGWVLEGQAFVIRDPIELVNRILPLAFHRVKFSSFTRKLYRWGFRQLAVGNHEGLDDSFVGQKVFGHVHFRKGDREGMKLMQSVTATTTRRAIALLASRQNDAARRIAQVHVDNRMPSNPVPFDLAVAQQSLLLLSQQLNHRADLTNLFCQSHKNNCSILQNIPFPYQVSPITSQLATATPKPYPNFLGESFGALIRAARASMLLQSTDQAEAEKLKKF